LALSRRIVAFHRRVADPRGSGPALAVCRALLSVGALGYGAAVRMRNRAYDRGRRRVHRAAVPVISVGNITAGGTGKTPFAAWLCALLRARNLRPAVLSRGYGASGRSGLDDENRVLSALAPGVAIVVDPDRVRGAARAVREHGAQALILDDGFQHRRLARDLDIVLIDALNPFGGGHLLPRGLLREPPGGLGRAGAIVITRSDQVPQERLEAIRRDLGRRAATPSVALAVHRPVGLRRMEGAEQDGGRWPLSELAEGGWAAFCGIANPDAFRLTLEGLGARVQQFTAFPDHHHYRPADLERLLERARRAGCRAVATTHKDAVKLQGLPASGFPLPLLVLEVRLEVVEGREALERLVLAATRTGVG